MVVINPEIENTLVLEGIEWKPLLTAHKKRSSIITVSPDQKYLKKTKKRKGAFRDNEFYNLEFWRNLFERYNKETKTEIYSPKPYVSEGRDLIMQYVSGIDLDRLFSCGTVNAEDSMQIIERIGKLLKIKVNEDLVHNDFDLRHILVDNGVFVIDLENAQYGNGEVETENARLVQRIKGSYKGKIDDALQRGYDSIPKLGALDGALEHVKSVYGGRAEFYLKLRYRNKT